MHSTIKNSIFYLSQIAISGVLMLVLMPIISQYLMPDELGQFVLAQVYAGIAVGIANFGMLLGYERNFFEFEKSKKDSARLISSAIIFVVFNLAILLSAVYLFQLEISNLILSKNTHSDLLLIVLVGAMFLSLSQYYLTFLKNSGLAKSYAKYVIGNSVIYFSLAVVFMVQLNLGVMSLAYAWIASNLILFALLFLVLRRELPIGFDKGMLKAMLKISLPLTPRILFGFMNTQLDKILLGLIGSSGLVGIYYMGQTFAATIFQFMTGLDRVFQPELYRKLFADKHINNSYEINNYILPFFYISIFAALIVVLFSKEFVLLFFSSEYQKSAPIITILSIYYASLFFGKVTGNQLIYAKKTHLTSLLTLLGIAINFGLNILFIINWGVLGAAWATTISGIVMTIVSFYFAQKHAKITWQWKSIFTIYSLFLAVTAFTMIGYSFSMDLYKILMMKFLIVFFYIIIGFMLKIISTKKIKDIFKAMRI
jgi:O-antigen/teichoic acid export membrane protein